MKRQSIAVIFITSSILALGCRPPESAMPRVQEEVLHAQVAGEAPLVGPFASWETICGARETPDAEEEGARWIRYARCTVEGEAPLAGAGELLKIATYRERGFGQGEGQLAVQTPSGWYLEALPTGETGPTMSHHSPVIGGYDAASSRAEGSVLHAVMRGGSSSFVPGMGSQGSSSRAWTRVRTCRASSGGVSCAALEEVWSQSCAVSAQGEQTCRESGTNIPKR